MAAHFFRMNKSNVSFRNRLLIWQYEYSDAVIGVAFFCAFAAMKSIAIVELQANPVIATQRVMGVVEYVRVKPIIRTARSATIYTTPTICALMTTTHGYLSTTM
ncbi:MULTISPECIES: hypothetical protein [unclassified Mesorhizobium]|uniref:hypothetical protein n=1 Tax=unclassified Mesorhizobium TaxID=325217 RepID=UPI0013E3B32F|nr:MULTISPECIES: hypothetical protein [unclassified Mesorhizobium]